MSSIDCLKVLVESRSITASTSASPDSLDHGLEVYLQTRTIMASKCISGLARSWPASSHHHGLQVYVQTRLITACTSASRNPLDHDLGVHLSVHSIMPSKCISKYAGSRPRSISVGSVDCHFQAHSELLSRTAGRQSRYNVCRWVAI